jgi:peptidyl-prolyl cis-trans isomerase SurA
MKSLHLFVFVLCINFLQFSALSQNKSDAVLTVDGEATSLEEFENIFRKNNRDSAITRQALDDYMELFINFKLKVKEARELGLDTVSKFKSELDGYRAQLARPYLTDTDKLNDLIQEAYSNMSQEVRAMHILVNCAANATPTDTLKAYSRIMALRERVLNGEDFSSVAKSQGGSDDPSVKDNGGDLGYFTAFQMVYPFEQAAYSTPVGQISKPVRTRYGYHILYVVDKRKARGEIRVAHIVVKPKAEANGELNAQTKIQEIYQKLKSSESTFEELAAKFSDDASSSKKGGELPWFGTGKMVAEFEDAAFGLQKDGDFSEPFKTDFGWHIVKRLELRSIAPLVDMEKEIKSKVSKDSRSEQTRKSFVEKLKKEYAYSINQKELSKIIAKADTNAFEGKIYVKKRALKKTLYSMIKNDVTVGEFNEFMRTKGRARPTTSPAEHVRNMADKFGEEKLLALEDARLEQKHTAFRLLMKEYREGILLFELTDQKVWSKAVKDSAGLADFYAQNKTKFMWPERAEVVFFTCANSDIAKRARKMIADGKDKSSIAAELNKDSQLNLQVEEGVFSKDDREILRKIEWKTGISSDIQENGQIKFVDVRALLAPAPKKLEEAKGLITSEYQNYLEQEWIKQLRSKYKFSVDKNVLYNIK